MLEDLQQICMDMSVGKKLKKGTCDDIRCVDFDRLCKVMKVDHGRHLQLLKDIRKVPGIKKAFVASGIRYDFMPADKKNMDMSI